MGSKTVSDERRRTPRFPCAGEVKIICLPSEGRVLPGRLRDLSLGGCCLETLARVDSGARTELILRVNSTIFRAISQVRAIRGPWALGLQFLQLSLTGQEELRQAVDRLARLHAQMNRMTAARQETQRELLLREMEKEGLHRYLAHFPIPGRTPLAEEQPSPSPESPRRSDASDEPGDDSSVDIFV